MGLNSNSMQNESISIRATKKDKKLHAKAAKVAGGKRDAVIAGLHHVARICAHCDKPSDDMPFRSMGYPVCRPCAEKGAKVDDTDVSILFGNG